MPQAVIIATVLVALAELGDKTQILSLVLASRYPARRVFLGVFVAVLALQLLAVVAGGLVGAVLPEGVLAAATALLFIGFGVWSFVDAGRDEDVDGASGADRGAFATIALVAGAFFVAELGDKTQVLTLAIAADPGAAGRALSVVGLDALSVEPGLAASIGVWVGSAIGMMLVNGAAIALGSVLGARLDRAVIGRISGAVFMVFGVIVAAAYLIS